MPVVNMKKMLEDARSGGYAIGAFNIVNDLTIRAAILAAEECGTPVILQTSVKTVKNFGIKTMIDMLKLAAGDAGVDIALHLDHCTDIGYAKACADAGWSSVMIDASGLPIKDNIKATKEMVDYCRGMGITVEGEVGAIAGVEDDIAVAEDKRRLADPVDCRRFISETGVDAFAPSVGTAHGLYKGEPKIDYDLFSQINSFSTCPLVLHGGTGLSDDVFIKLVALGAAKINISTAIKMAYCQGMKKYLEQKPVENNPLALDGSVFDGVRELVSHYIKLFAKPGEKNNV